MTVRGIDRTLCNCGLFWLALCQAALIFTGVFVCQCLLACACLWSECGVSRVTAPNCPGVWLFIPHRSGICWQTKASKSGGVLSVRSHLMGPLQTLETVSLANIYPSYGLTGSNNHMNDFIGVPCYFSSPLVVKRVCVNIVEKKCEICFEMSQASQANTKLLLDVLDLLASECCNWSFFYRKKPISCYLICLSNIDRSPDTYSLNWNYSRLWSTTARTVKINVEKDSEVGLPYERAHKMSFNAPFPT